MERSFLIKPILEKNYPIIDYGKGIYLFSKNGKKYLDASSGAVTANIGHGVEEIIHAMYEQSKKISFVYRSQFTSEAAEELAKRLASLMPGDLNWSFFVNSGSEATETALKIAVQYWQELGMHSKTKVLSRWVSYHGITLGALSMSGHPARRARFTPLLEDFPSISPPYCYRCPYSLTPQECGNRCALELDTVIKRIGSENIAAFIAEPVIGAAGGALTPPKDYYKIIKNICDDHQILFIADEVMTGFGRTGTMLACEQWGVVPDLVALGKGMAAGYSPIAATVVRDKILEPILKGSKSIMSGHTLSANPQSCSAALAVLNYLSEKKILSEVESKAVYLRNKLEQLKNAFDFIGDIRGQGLLLGIEFVQCLTTKKSYPSEMKLTEMVVSAGQNNGILLYPAGSGIDGKSGDAIIIAPPLTITKREIDELIRLFSATMNQVYSELKIQKENGGS